MAIETTSVQPHSQNPNGLEVSWRDGQFVMIVAEKGLLSCGIVDKAIMEKFEFAVAIARGTPENPLVTTADLLEARIVDVTPKAAELGIQIGMTGNDALALLSPAK